MAKLDRAVVDARANDSNNVAADVLAMNLYVAVVVDVLEYDLDSRVVTVVVQVSVDKLDVVGVAVEVVGTV